jgi:hypothetical protein
MKLACVDGSEREFIPVRDKLIQIGFDPTLLDRDEQLVSTSIPPDMGFFQALKLAGSGTIVPSYIFHYSKKSKQLNPISIDFETFISSVTYVSFLPSIETEKETSTDGPMASLPFIARVLSKIFRKASNTSDRSIFQTQIFGENLSNFKFNYGYKVSAYQWVDKSKDFFLLIKDESDQYMAVHPSLLCVTNKVFITEG